MLKGPVPWWTAGAFMLLLLANSGCPKEIVSTRQMDPDINAGLDAMRAGAKLMSTNHAETDSVSWPNLIRTKWKQIEVLTSGTQNILDCELRIDNTGADLNIDLFNSLGTQIGFSPGPVTNKLKKLAVQLDEVGTYFVRIQAAQPRDQSDFSVRCSWDEEREMSKRIMHMQSPLKPRRATSRRGSEMKFAARLGKGTEGRIVQWYREGNRTFLNIDKGALAGVQQGTEGLVLYGNAGRESMRDSNFHILRVVDDRRSIAETKVKALGRNNRILLLIN